MNSNQPNAQSTFSPTPMAIPSDRPKNKWKPVGIVFIILFCVATIGGIFASYQLFDTSSRLAKEQVELDDVKTELSDAKQKLDAISSNGSDTDDDDTTAQKPIDMSNLGVNVDEILAARTQAGQDSNGMTVTVSSITNSYISPYQTLVVMVNRSDGDGHIWSEQYYRNTPDSEWIYTFGDMQRSPSCDALSSNPDAQKAFSSEPCIDNENRSSNFGAYYKL